VKKPFTLLKPFTLFEITRAELRAPGITLDRLPGEYRVNFHNGRAETARTVETIDQALVPRRNFRSRIYAKYLERVKGIEPSS
jgi:hypothetical protein